VREFRDLPLTVCIPPAETGVRRIAMTLRTILVKDYMVRRLVTLSPESEILHAVHTLIDKDIAGAPVVDQEGALIGMLTERDCMRAALNATYHSEYGGTVADFMSTDVEVMAPEDSIADAAKRFLEGRFHRYPVLDQNRLVGQISRRDVMRALGDTWQ
jgi:CBS domain-containing protein